MSCRVLVVESSGALSRRLLGLFGRELELARSPVTPAEMPEAVRSERPAVVLAEVAGDAGELELAIELTMAEAPVPIVLVARAAVERQVALGLLAAGALDVAALPDKLTDEQGEALVRQLLLVSQVTVVRHPRGSRRRTPVPASVAGPGFPVVAIAASLGGPKALVTLLGDLPRGFGAPILVCQHITAGFSDDLARWLGSETGLAVHEAKRGQRVVAGEVYVAPSDVHLVAKPSGELALDASAPVGGFRPSCNVLLRSVAQAYGSRAIGVVLTGMGRDGAEGLKEIRVRGGHTVAQAEDSCVVFGMPGEAIALGGAEKVLALDEIAAQLARWVP